MDSYSLQGKVVLEDRILNPGIVYVSNGKIAAVEPLNNIEGDHFEFQGKWICPGFIDTHLHALDGFDFMDATSTSFKEIQSRLPRYGVTSFLATSRTESEKYIKNFLSISQRIPRQDTGQGAHFLGVHLEGPWLSQKYSGAQKTDLIQDPHIEKVIKLIDEYGDIIKLITLAPEVTGANQVVQFLAGKGIVVSAGHSAASLEEMDIAIRSGVSQVTHCFNGMSPFHHRNPGLAFAAMHREELNCELIADGQHVHPEVIKFLYKVKTAAKIMLISDCTGANQLIDGSHELGGKTIYKQGKRITLQDGTLAGSAITIDEAVKFLIKEIGIPIEEVIRMASTNPAIALNQQKGGIQTGFDADLVILDEDYKVFKTIIGGKTYYQQEGGV
jgi:N-acetylglucosamine-6-phosphate deacetylase